MARSHDSCLKASSGKSYSVIGLRHERCAGYERLRRGCTGYLKVDIDVFVENGRRRRQARNFKVDADAASNVYVR